MIQNLSYLKYFFLLDLNFKRKLGLNENEKKLIHKIFPNTFIEETNEKSSLTMDSRE